MDLVERVYRVSQGFPKEETFGLASQIRRAAVSIPSNIAEGHSREHLKEYLNHLSMARASLAEVETHLEIAARLGYLESDEVANLVGNIGSLGNQIYTLRNSLAAKASVPIPDRLDREVPP
jgi:four helix bundle protein